MIAEWEDGSELAAIWWEPDGELKVRENSTNEYDTVSLTLQQARTGDMCFFCEWYVRAETKGGKVTYHNMRYISGFAFKDTGQ